VVTVTTAAPPPPGGTVFTSDWSTATGNGSNAFTDGGRWVQAGGDAPSPVMSIVAGSTVGWTRTPNVARVQFRGASGGSIQIEAQNVIPASTTHWGRFYVRNDETANMNWHPTAYNTVGDIQMVPFFRDGRSSGWYIGLQLAGHSYPYVVWQAQTALPNGQWFRYEWQVEYVSATRYRFHVRVYNMAGTLVLDDDDLMQADYSGSGHSLASFQAAGNTFSVNNAALARNFGLGNEGPAGSTNSGQYYYFASVALSTSGWIGQ
jgi:hypothetical protein